MITLSDSKKWIGCLAMAAVVMVALMACSGTTRPRPVVLTDAGGALQPLTLPAPQKDIGRPLMQVLAERKTTRDFLTEKLSGQVLSNLLWAAFGINRLESGKRTAPSALNWQEIDIYVALESGLYVYEPVQHILKPVLGQDIRSKTTRAFQPSRSAVDEAPATLIYVADFAKPNAYGLPQSESQKTLWAHADTGFIAQNVYLFCASSGLGTVVRGLVDRPKLSQVMQLRPQQHIILCQTVGYSASESRPKTAFDLQTIPDGTYPGSASLESTDARVTVRVEGHRITDITPLDLGDSDYADQAATVVEHVLKAQSTEVDAVSGATVSSQAVLKAVENALAGARPE